MAVALASYLTGAGGMHTTVAECNSSHDFARLEQYYELCEQELSDTEEFRIKGVRYVKAVSEKKRSRLLAAGQECLILDFGSRQESREAFRGCRSCIVMASLREWKQVSFVRFMEETAQNEERSKWHFVLKDGQKADIQEMERRYRISFKRMPAEEDPFHIRRENIAFYKSLLERR